MNSMLTCLTWEFRLQSRYYFWLTGLVVTLMWVVLLLAVSDQVRATAIPLLIFADIGTIGLLFIAGMLYLERRQGTLYVNAVMPVPAWAWLSTKVLGLSLLCGTCAIVIVLFNPGSVNWWRMIPAAILSGTLFTGIGFLLAIPFDRILNYFLAMALGLTLLNLPILDYLGIYSSPWMWLIPSNAALQLLAAGYQDVSISRYLAILVLLLVWIGLFHFLGIRSYRRFIALRPQA